MRFIFSTMLALGLMVAPALAAEAPVALEITGLVFGEKITNAAIVDGSIWWEGMNRICEDDDGHQVILRLVNVEKNKATFEVLGRSGPTRFQVSLKNSSAK